MFSRIPLAWRCFLVSFLLVILTASSIWCPTVSGLTLEGKSADFEYYHCSGNWHRYIRFYVDDYNSSNELAIIRVICETSIETTIEDFRLKIPDWTIVYENGTPTNEKWLYCPIWLDLSDLDEGFVFDDPDSWLYNFTVDTKTSTSCTLERVTLSEEFTVYQHLYYDVNTNRIRQYDYSQKDPDNNLRTVRLKILDTSWHFSSTTTQANAFVSLDFLLIAGIAIEITLIILILRSKNTKD